MPRTRKPLPVERLAYSIAELHRAGGPGKTTLYKLINGGLVRTVKVGRLTKIPVDEARRLLGIRA